MAEGHGGPQERRGRLDGEAVAGRQRGQPLGDDEGARSGGLVSVRLEEAGTARMVLFQLGHDVAPVPPAANPTAKSDEAPLQLGRQLAPIRVQRLGRQVESVLLAEQPLKSLLPERKAAPWPQVVRQELLVPRQRSQCLVAPVFAFRPSRQLQTAQEILRPAHSDGGNLDQLGGDQSSVERGLALRQERRHACQTTEHGPVPLLLGGLQIRPRQQVVEAFHRLLQVEARRAAGPLPVRLYLLPGKLGQGDGSVQTTRLI